MSYLKKIFFSLSLFLIVLIALFSFYPTSEQKWDVEVLREGQSLFPSSFPHAGSVIRITATKEGQLIHQQLYHTDQFSMRTEAKNQNAKKQAIFTGCSFVWGTGVSEEETLTHYFQSFNPEVQAYNLGFAGGGLHSILNYIEHVKLNSAVSQLEGYFFYVFFVGHLERFFLDFSYLNWADPDSPFFEVKKGKALYKGKVGDQNAYKSFNLLKKIGLHRPLMLLRPVFTDAELNAFADAIADVKRKYLHLFPKGEFVFVWHSLHDINSQDKERLRKRLDEKGIKHFDSAADFTKEITINNLSLSNFTIPVDLHPNHRYNSFFAQWLTKQLNR